MRASPELTALSSGAACGAMLAKAIWKQFWMLSGGSLEEPNRTTLRTALLKYFDENVAPELPPGEPAPGSKVLFLELFRKSCADSFMTHLAEYFEKHAKKLKKGRRR